MNILHTGPEVSIVQRNAGWEPCTANGDGVLDQQLAMKPRQRCRGTFLHQFLVESVV